METTLTVRKDAELASTYQVELSQPLYQARRGAGGAEDRVKVPVTSMAVRVSRDELVGMLDAILDAIPEKDGRILMLEYLTEAAKGDGIAVPYGARVEIWDGKLKITKNRTRTK